VVCRRDLLSAVCSQNCVLYVNLSEISVSLKLVNELAFYICIIVLFYLVISDGYKLCMHVFNLYTTC
jgi:hypothetical protein